MSKEARVSLKNYFGSWTKIGILVGVLVLALIAFFVSQEAFITAEVTDFYPSTCLGSWQDPEKAQGEPETFRFPEKELNNDNSAYLDKAEGDIYCGQFLPGDYVGEGEIKGVGLTLVWNVQGLPELVLPEPTVTPETTSTPNADEDIPTSEGAVIKDVIEAPTERTKEESSNGDSAKEEPATPPSSLNRFLVPLVLAQSEEPSAPASTVEPAPVQATEPPVISNPEPINEPVVGAPKETEVEKNPPINEELKNENGEEIKPEEVKIGEVLAEPVTEIIHEAPKVVDESFLRISYSLDGQEWKEISKIGAANWFHYTMPLPINSWEDLRKAQFRIEGIENSLETFPEIYLDGMFLEVQYEKPPIVEIFETAEVVQEPVREVELPEGVPLIVIPEGEGLKPAPTDEKNFSPNERPSFEFDLENLPSGDASGGTSRAGPRGNIENRELSIREESMAESGIANKREGRGKNGVSKNSNFGFLRPGFLLGRFVLSVGDFNFLNRARAQSDAGVKVLNEANPVIAQVIDSAGEPTAIAPTILTINNKLRVNVPEPKRSLRPGIYKLRVWVLREGKVFFSETEFTWGVFAINFDKSIYTLGDKANVGMAVLDDGGHTICDAQISLRVVLPSGSEVNFSTRDGSIIYSDTCGPDNVTQEADYKTNFAVNATGTYKIFATTRTANGLRDFEDKFEVQENPLFDVVRSGPTRIFPPAEYRVSMRITPKEDFDGIVKEVVPAEFRVVANESIDERVVGEERILIWSLDLKAGERREISYIFKAPDISPEFYKLGPLGFYENSDDIRPIFSEIRSWQIAADVVVNDGSAMVYGDAANDSTSTVRYISATSTTGSAVTTVAVGAGTTNLTEIKHVSLKAAPTRVEYVSGQLLANGRLDFIKASGTTWGNLFNVSSSAVQICDNSLGACNQTFDLAYEQLSGRALMVYGSSSNDGIIYYRTWDGNATSSESSFTFNNGSSNDTNWVRLVPKGDRLTDNRSNEMMLLVADAGGGLFAAYWDGTQFLTSTTLDTMPTANGRAFDGAWETVSGNFIAAYASSSSSSTLEIFAYRKFSGGAWSAPSSTGPGDFFTDFSGNVSTGMWVSLAADPLSNRIAGGFEYQISTNIGASEAEGVWKRDGTSEDWNDISAQGVALESDEVFGQVQAGFERFGTSDGTSTAIFTINTGSFSDTADYMTWIPSTGMAAAIDIPGGWTDDGNHRKLVPSPNRDDMVWLGVDSDNDLNDQYWHGTGWNATGAELSTAVATTTDGNAIPMENNAFDFAWRPYSPWSLNWRWYNGTSTADTPPDALAAENTSSSISSSSMKLRLRFNVAEEGGNDQTDARKKLQWTTSTTPEASSTVWSDVGNVGSSTIWRYFDPDTGSAVGNDGTVVAATVLSSSTAAGWWNLSKDATANANMDHASTTIRELEFPIEGNNADTGYTYYFRMYDVDQGSPVYRFQPSWPTTPCNSAVACSYPRIFISPPVPSVTSVNLNGGSAITLLPNTTTTIYVNFTVTDASGCSDVFTSGNVTTTIYRSGVLGTCSLDDLNCYRVTTSTHNCSGGSTANGTSTFDVYYFAQATDGTSAFPSQYWEALVEARDGSNNTTTATSTGVDVNGLLAIELVTSTINYGSLNPTSTMGAVNRLIPIRNVGNSSNTIQVYGSALKKGSNSIATSSQHYASSSFVFGGNEGQISNTATTISGLTVLPHTSVLNTIGSWSGVTALPSTLLYHAVAGFGDYIYLVGGAPGGSGTTTTVKYAAVAADGTLGSWTNTAALQSGIVEHGAVSSNGYMYVAGGGTTASNFATATTTVKYSAIAADGTLGAWSNTTALTSPIMEHEIVVYGGRIYSMGGLVASNTGTTTVKYASISADGTVGSWSDTTALSAALYEFEADEYNGYIYVTGGEVAGSAVSTVYYAKIQNDGTLSAWTTGTALSTNLNDHSAVASNGYLYRIGGHTAADASRTSTVAYSVLSANGSMGSWTDTTVYPFTNAYGEEVVSRGYVFEVSGFPGGVTTTVKSAPILNGLSEANTFWGLGLSDYVPTGTYTGSTTFIGVFSP